MLIMSLDEDMESILQNLQMIEFGEHSYQDAVQQNHNWL